nr:hypothetical protein [Tanacetum cinerariifolium]
MDLEEWERIENEPPLLHLYAKEFEVHECEEEETYEVRMTKDVYDKRENDSDDDSVMPRLIAHDKSVNRAGVELLEPRLEFDDQEWVGMGSFLFDLLGSYLSKGLLLLRAIEEEVRDEFK